VFQIIPVEPAAWINVQEQQTLVTFSVLKNLSDLLLQFVFAKLSITVSTASLI
jgi:hypothetical protein